MSKYEHSFVRIPNQFRQTSENLFKLLDIKIEAGWEVFDTQQEIDMGKTIAYIFFVRRIKKD